MHIVKKITAPFLFCFICLLCSKSIAADIPIKLNVDSTKSPKIDTAKIRAYRLKNNAFNQVYIQNLRPATFGQEFFDPHKTLLVSDLAANFLLVSSSKIPVFFVANFRVNLRLFAAYGSPVKSPSYMPGGTLYFRLNSNSYNPQFFSVSYTHHSNGIEGPTLNPNGTINTDSGKFTTNFYTFTYHIGTQTTKGNLMVNQYDALGLELHSALLGLGYAHALKGIYGFVRVNGSWIYNISKATNDPIDEQRKKDFVNWQRLQLDFTYIADKYDNYNAVDLKKRLNVSLKYYYQFPFMQNVAFLVGAGYRGQDDLNIFFQDSYPYVMAGVAAGLSFGLHKNQ
jgi:hypothetical protein